jgi:hypothetical protein
VQLSCRAGVARAAGPSAAAAPFIPPSSRLDLDLNYDDPFGPFQAFSTPPCNPSQNSSERQQPRGWSASSERPPPGRPYLSLPRRRRQPPPSVRRPQRQPRQPVGPPRPLRVRAACQVTHPSATDPDRPALGRPDRARLAHRRTRPAASPISRPARPRVRLALTAPPRFVLLTSMPPHHPCKLPQLPRQSRHVPREPAVHHLVRPSSCCSCLKSPWHAWENVRRPRSLIQSVSPGR